MVIAELIEVSTGKKVFAEVRKYKKEEAMTVLAKDFATAKMIPLLLLWKDDKFQTEDGVYETTFEWTEMVESPTKLVKVSKK